MSLWLTCLILIPESVVCLAECLISNCNVMIRFLSTFTAWGMLRPLAKWLFWICLCTGREGQSTTWIRIPCPWMPLANPAPSSHHTERRYQIMGRCSNWFGFVVYRCFRHWALRRDTNINLQNSCNHVRIRPVALFVMLLCIRISEDRWAETLPATPEITMAGLFVGSS
jgi:hypothetical protein